jgi:predicted hotdog family 3-hydroxylacyl-ACP dehydratase
MSDCPYMLAELLPHAPPMILLDEIVDCTADGCVAAVAISPQSRFYIEDRGVPSYAGLEYMAQTCGLHVGRLARSQGLPVRIGYLLGTRDFHVEIGWFPPGMRLTVHVTEVLREEPMGVFDCRIVCEGRTIASARLNVYQPPVGATAEREK